MDNYKIVKMSYADGSSFWFSGKENEIEESISSFKDMAQQSVIKPISHFDIFNDGEVPLSALPEEIKNKAEILLQEYAEVYVSNKFNDNWIVGADFSAYITTKTDKFLAGIYSHFKLKRLELKKA